MRVLMLGWEFPPYVSGGLGRHCYELTRGLAGQGTKILFFMPKKGTNVNVPWAEIVGISPRTNKKQRTGKTDAPSGWKEVDQLSPYPIGPYNEGRAIQLNPYTYIEPAAPTGERPAVQPQEFTKLEEPNYETENYPTNFFEAVMTYNQSVVQEAMTRIDQFDVIHAHDWITMPAAVEIKKRTGKPLVVTVHSTEKDRTANIYPMEWIVSIERHGVKNADRVIAVSKMTKQQLIDEHHVPADKIHVVYNAVNPEEYKGENPEKQEHIVLFAGRLTSQKGPIFFLKTAREVLDHRPDMKIKFIVCGKGDLLPGLIEEAVHMGLTGKVTFTGFIPDDELVKIYNSADVYVLPSVSEPFGITVLEAMSARTPVIVSKTSGVSEVIKHCFRVDFWDTNEMANKIISILSHEPLKKCMTANAEREADLFDWNEVAKKTIKVYREMM
ncbi:glycosyltransferase family 4 protein [archaeon]|nr:glycosyltransferase family 4 protein [archaeon]